AAARALDAHLDMTNRVPHDPSAIQVGDWMPYTVTSEYEDAMGWHRWMIANGYYEVGDTTVAWRRVNAEGTADDGRREIRITQCEDSTNVTMFEADGQPAQFDEPLSDRLTIFYSVRWIDGPDVWRVGLRERGNHAEEACRRPGGLVPAVGHLWHRGARAEAGRDRQDRATFTVEAEIAEGQPTTEDAEPVETVAYCTDQDGNEVPCYHGNGVWTGECHEYVVSEGPWDSDPYYAHSWGMSGYTGGFLTSCYPGDHSTAPCWRLSREPAPPVANLQQEALLMVSGAVFAPEIGLFPGGQLDDDHPDAMGLVGMPAWFWAKDAGPGIGYPHTVSATKDGYTLSATARFSKTVHDTDDDEVMTCHTLGDDPGGHVRQPTRPYQGCYHIYEHKGDYHITATAYFTVDWTGAGRHGVISGLSVRREADYRIGEIQVLIVNR
ncbi:MAG: hypothetical protein LBH76_04045, partial [Propionibacteriaceae bacterium]|nr:hypothetical protein [Propionibacteriaceae bacterium]